MLQSYPDRPTEIRERADTFMEAGTMIADARNEDSEGNPNRTLVAPLSEATCVRLARHDFAMVDCYRKRLLDPGGGRKPRVQMPKVGAFCFLAACLNHPYESETQPQSTQSEDTDDDPRLVLNFRLGLAVAITVIQGHSGNNSFYEPMFDAARQRLLVTTDWYYYSVDERVNPFCKHSFSEFERCGAIQKFTRAELQHIDYLINIFEMWESAVLQG